MSILKDSNFFCRYSQATTDHINPCRACGRGVINSEQLYSHLANLTACTHNLQQHMSASCAILGCEDDDITSCIPINTVQESARGCRSASSSVHGYISGIN